MLYYLRVAMLLYYITSHGLSAFDYYVFAYSWTPEFCYGHSADYPGCNRSQINPFWNTSFTIHGLWPQNYDNTYPTSCTTEPFDENIPYEIGWNTMTTYWPDVKYLETDPNYDSFWEHEWTKHGTCSQLSQSTYFNTTIQLAQMLGTPPEYTTNVGHTMSASFMRELFGGHDYAALQCNNGKYIVGVYTCWSNSGGYPKTQILCDDSVLQEDTCSADELIIYCFPPPAR